MGGGNQGKPCFPSLDYSVVPGGNNTGQALRVKERCGFKAGRVVKRVFKVGFPFPASPLLLSLSKRLTNAGDASDASETRKEERGGDEDSGIDTIIVAGSTAVFERLRSEERR